MIAFKVLLDFQHDGVDYEEGNSHKKHRLPDSDVNTFHKAGWIEINGEVGGSAQNHAVVQPDDLKINLVGE